MRAISWCILAGVLVLACHGPDTGGQPGSNASTTPPAVAPSGVVPSAGAAPAAAPTPTGPSGTVEIQISSVANTMTFDKTTLIVRAGAPVHLTFKNNSTIPVPHNWVLVNKGAEASVAAAGLPYGEASGYIDIHNPDLIAHTPLAKAGETVDVTFTAPAAGDYPYICTVPGHYVMMKGVLTVTP